MFVPNAFSYVVQDGFCFGLLYHKLDTCVFAAVYGKHQSEL